MDKIYIKSDKEENCLDVKWSPTPYPNAHNVVCVRVDDMIEELNAIMTVDNQKEIEALILKLKA